MSGLRTESRDKLIKFKPKTLLEAKKSQELTLQTL